MKVPGTGLLLFFAAAVQLESQDVQVHGCSDFLLNTTKSSNNVVSARTMDFVVDLESAVEVIPRGTVFQEFPVANCSDCPDYRWESKYGFVALNVFGYNSASDGMNEMGLSAGELYLTGSEYPIPEKARVKVDSETATDGDDLPKPIVTSLCSFIMGNFATTDEVREGLSHVQIGGLDERAFDVLLNTKLGLGRIPLHISVRDATGSNLVIEFLHGEVIFYDNTNLVLTNDPPLDQQLAELAKNGYGKYPSGYGATERFLRLSVLNHFAPKDYELAPPGASYLAGTSEQKAISAALHILNTVVLPPVEDATEWSIVRDHGRKKLYIQSTNNQLLRLVDLNRLDFSDPESRRMIPVTYGNWYVDATDALLSTANAAKTKDLPPRTSIASMKQVESDQDANHSTVSSPSVPAPEMIWTSNLHAGHDESSRTFFLFGCVCGTLFAGFLGLVGHFLHKRWSKRQGYEPIAESTAPVKLV